MNKLSLVIFDMDGLLIDSERYMWKHNQKIAIDEFGYEYDDNFFRSLMGTGEKEFPARLREHYGNDFPSEQFWQRTVDLNKDIIENNKIPLMIGAYEICEYLKSINMPMCVATSSLRKNAELILSNLKLINYFDYLVCGDEVQYSKPNPEIYLKAMKNIPKDEVLVFEDGHAGVEAAYLSGANVIMVPDLLSPSSEDKNMTYAIVNSLFEGMEIIKQILNK